MQGHRLTGQRRGGGEENPALREEALGESQANFNRAWRGVKERLRKANPKNKRQKGKPCALLWRNSLLGVNLSPNHPMTKRWDISRLLEQYLK